ncbi:23S rRNA (adenine(1618)-N(6))-methyltransferase RlmF [Undibacterium flavidum]|uniref:Ribosomal RNA large subunit methyltransferase F n=1 Tax=Undibacterium flavidum TaxID=2762297 RepID=A0ABR6YDU4_9BURK|nr:23S rRNA (adenine(1618)-N(6))-methyltransferase RlmF [Undibacterium flavidum]MBC3874725.1 23S rRNA (adenine(1618)-N(6))-methyltransferase RlmF [Undibacterium flavidum]
MSNPRHKSSTTSKQSGFHPRNRHQGQYDFTALIEADRDADTVALGRFVSTNPYGDLSIDFADANAVKALNRALLKHQYGIEAWDIPDAYLCPPVPGRADYIHGLADLLITVNQGKLPKKNSVYVLDIGTGANGIYPLIGSQEYTWNFVAADINDDALANLESVIHANPQLVKKIELRLQKNSSKIFHNILQQDEWFDLTMCNPPFHTSAAEAQSGTDRKWQNLGKTAAQIEVNLNFGGQAAELWCPGGELQFISQMIEESRQFSTQCFWFSSLISKSANLDPIKAKLKQAKVLEHRLITMQQGSKQSRFIAWTFLTPAQQLAWAKLRWR